MAELKTKATSASVAAFLKTVNKVLGRRVARSVTDMKKMYECT